MLTVAIAFAMNVLVAIAKSIAAVVTGSASMMAEAAHSWADAGNEVFLLIAERRGAKGRDRKHPFGYGRETYVWSMIAAFGLFTVGAVVSIMHGINAWSEPEAESNYLVGYIVLAIAAVLESVSFAQTIREAKAGGRRMSMHPLKFVSRTGDATLRAVFAEDAAALIGLVIAAAGMGLHQVTGDGRWDAVGSILVGVLLGFVALFLIGRNRQFLVGQVAPPQVQTEVLARMLARPDIDRVTYLHVEYVGPSQFYLVAAVDIVGDLAESSLAPKLRKIEADIERDEMIVEAVLTLSTDDERSLSHADEGPITL
ncbi:MAG: cation diffusion facilitator family transporter [Gordonia sp. (in: high G+C Gram-positive bacteria)]|uniref:cation diffusion facilitator family transporter n=1 Tax=Gordonia sp. (in: high G+C Gram-positive bacteria) TaxID=84139 RepID=UPI0039E4152F